MLCVVLGEALPGQQGFPPTAPHLILSGGNPWARADLEELHVSDLG